MFMDLQDLRKKNIRLAKRMLKESVSFNDFVVQGINNIDEINRAANTLVKRLREWYELYNPEFSRRMADHEQFVDMVISGKASKDKDSMGADLNEEDLKPILSLAKEIHSLYDLKQKQEIYLDEVMKKNCANITAVAGALIGARLIALAGDLKRLIFFPASTVQLLGAEKALFRHMKTGAKPPRHGVIIKHPLISEAPQKEHGKRARALADKILMAAKVDYFKGDFIGDKLKKEMEAKLK